MLLIVGCHAIDKNNTCLKILIHTYNSHNIEIMLGNTRWNPMSEKFNQQIIPLNNNFIIAFEEIVIFKFYYQDDNKKTWRTSTGRNEGTNVSVSTTLLSKDKKTPQVSRSTTTIPSEAFSEKKKQQEQWRRAEEGTSEEQPKDMRKYKKDLNDAFIVCCQFVFFLACFLKNGIILF